MRNASAANRMLPASTYVRGASGEDKTAPGWEKVKLLYKKPAQS